MSGHGRGRRPAFTLVELLAIVVVIGVLAALTMPVFSAMLSEARTASVEASLAQVRAALARYRVDAVLEGGDPLPTLSQLTDVGAVMLAPIDANPFNGRAGVRPASRSQASTRRVVDEGAFGWAYFVDNTPGRPSAVFYANSAAATARPGGDGALLGANQL